MCIRDRELAPLLPHLGPQGPDGRQMEVDGPGAQLTPAGEGHDRLPQPGQDGPQEDDGRAHLPHQGVGHVPAGEGGGVHRHRVSRPVSYTHLLQPHMSGMILILAIGASILFAAGIHLGLSLIHI